MIPVLSGIHSVARSFAFDPDHAVNGFLYVFYTAPADYNRVSRLMVDARDRTVLEEVVLIDRIPASDGGRNGGAMTFADDGRLYIATGDAGQPRQAQNLASLSGKVIRFSPDHRICEIWARGLRDPQQIEIDRAGRLIVTDRGADGLDRSHVVQRGANLRTSSTLLSHVRPAFVTSHLVKWNRN